MTISKIAIMAVLPLATVIGSVPASAQQASSDVARDGSCPTGFKQSGDRCTSSNGKVALPKLGSCPTGFKASANYCVGDKGDYAEVRDGSCPTGLKTSGRYCVK